MDNKKIIDINTIVADQRKYFRTNATKSYEWRIAQLNGLTKFLDEKESEIAAAVQKDMGKSSFQYDIGERVQLRNGINYAIKYLSSWMAPTSFGRVMNQFPATAHIHAEPLGVILILATWNFPFQQALSPVIGAIAAGNCVLIKPSEHTPSCAEVLGNYLSDYVDAEAIAVVTGGPEVAIKLLRENKFDHILFTGSSKNGTLVYQAAAAKLTPVTLELGGKSPVIVDETANIDLTARRLLFGKSLNCGQICIAPDYVLVMESVQESLMDAFRKAYSEFFPDGPAKDPEYGRIVNDAHFQRLSELADEDPDIRGKIIVGGDRDAKTKFMAPTVFNNTQPHAKLMTDEIFGPLLPCLGVRSLEDALSFINDRPKPLSAYIFTTNQQNVDRMIEETSSGGLCINDVIMQFTIPQLPFGGVGQSGFGSIHGKTSFDTFSHAKSVLHQSAINVFDPAPRYPPYTDNKKWILRKIL